MKMEGTDRYYFPCDGEFRKISWRPRFRESSELTVARKAYLPVLSKTVFIHYAVNAGFDHFEKRVYLGLSPTLILTDDGKTPSTGEKEGAVLTSLLNKRYNQTFLNEVLFWAQQFSEGKGLIGLAHGRALISSQPATSTLGVGVLADRPVSEEIPEFSQQGAGN